MEPLKNIPLLEELKEVEHEMIKNLFKLVRKSNNLNKRMLWDMKFNSIYSLLWMVIFFGLGILVGLKL